ncbi:hypothetical protein NXS98_04155 [Fontisphaera persica]|uniref:hypothetical protein n=1 Tax=Fontisphaera persica TaxID=2974023 RepID=UPI0024C04A27|nr:hypothetical protein [Fontisphaera persica]WCJ60332.1 hypothetical protein NXS98_04155 [Fontisphaera persica]
MLMLALYGLASMHCVLEGVPGFGFLKTCCFVDSAPPASQDCESDECAVENENYRAEEQNASAPQPLFILAVLSVAIEVPLPALECHAFVAGKPPPELPRVWQFSYRTALPPRAPSPLA